MPHSVRVLDSHTEGEPTRLILEGVPALAGETLAQMALDFELNAEEFRTGVLLEPRGSDVWVGALLLPPQDPGSAAAVIYFNNVGNLGMCGHATIGLVASLAHLGRIHAGEHVIETPVGNVATVLHPGGSVTFRNIASYRFRARVELSLAAGKVVGDIAYGGNWFFIDHASSVQVDLSNIEGLRDRALAIKAALVRDAITGADGAAIDHIELCGPSSSGADSKNFVLCPGNAFDRSPCGTGTSAKLACLAADAKLQPGEVYRQEGILGTVFEGSYELESGKVVPSITGRAWVTAESTLVFHDDDPFRDGISM